MNTITINGKFRKPDKSEITPIEYITAFDGFVRFMEKKGYEFSGDTNLTKE